MLMMMMMIIIFLVIVFVAVIIRKCSRLSGQVYLEIQRQFKEKHVLCTIMIMYCTFIIDVASNVLVKLQK